MEIEYVCSIYALKPQRAWRSRRTQPDDWTSKELPISDPRVWVRCRTAVGVPDPSVARARDLTAEFERLRVQWERDTINLSDVGQIILHDAYQRMIGLGPAALPLIFAALAAELGFWFPALRAITRDDPVPPEELGDPEAMRTAWLSWARRHGYLPA
jgi:hypothetical protein